MLCWSNLGSSRIETLATYICRAKCSIKNPPILICCVDRIWGPLELRHWLDKFVEQNV
jgi:hypothetical protein